MVRIMKLYHFTSRENLVKIIDDGMIKPINGVIWLTNEMNYYKQLWAKGTGKAEVRITLNTMNFKRSEQTESLDIYGYRTFKGECSCNYSKHQNELGKKTSIMPTWYTLDKQLIRVMKELSPYIASFNPWSIECFNPERGHGKYREFFTDWHPGIRADYIEAMRLYHPWWTVKHYQWYKDHPTANPMIDQSARRKRRTGDSIDDFKEAISGFSKFTGFTAFEESQLRFEGIDVDEPLTENGSI